MTENLAWIVTGHTGKGMYKLSSEEQSLEQLEVTLGNVLNMYKPIGPFPGMLLNPSITLHSVNTHCNFALIGDLHFNSVSREVIYVNQHMWVG